MINRLLGPVYDRFTLREKGLFTLFLAVMLLLAGIEIAKNVQLHLQDWSTNHTQKELQAIILQREAAYDQQFAAIHQRFNPQLTLDESELRNRLEAICLQMNLSYQIESRLPQKEGRFSLHAVRLSLNKINMEALLAFHKATLRSSPYMRLDAISLIPIRGKEEINARFTFKSFEMDANNVQFQTDPN